MAAARSLFRAADPDAGAGSCCGADWELAYAVCATPISSPDELPGGGDEVLPGDDAIAWLDELAAGPQRQPTDAEQPDSELDALVAVLCGPTALTFEPDPDDA